MSPSRCRPPARPTTPTAPASAAATCGPLRRAVDDRDRGARRRGRAHRRSPAPHHRRRARTTRIPSISTPCGGQRGDEAGAVGAVPREPPVAERHDGVDAAQRGGRRVEHVDGVGDVLLVRHGHRQTTEAEHAHRRRGPPPALAGRDVERHVHPVDAGRGERRVVQRRRQAVANGAADDGGQLGCGRDHPSSPRSRACCTLTSCCSSVAANTWWPSRRPPRSTGRGIGRSGRSAQIGSPCDGSVPG